jgi:protein-S-isoprenylcysteine O-methyltransferase Ste14
MISIRLLWLALCLCWLAAEIRLARQATAPSTALQVQGSQRSLWLVLLFSVCLALLLKNLAWLNLPIAYLPRQWLAIPLFLAGVALRYWAIGQLGRFFSTELQIQTDHQLITSGPYRWLRHPTYTGLLLALSAAGLAMGDGLALLVLTVLPFWAFKGRIKREEALLLEQFGETYRRYSQNTGRLLPKLF